MNKFMTFVGLACMLLAGIIAVEWIRLPENQIEKVGPGQSSIVTTALNNIFAFIGGKR